MNAAPPASSRKRGLEAGTRVRISDFLAEVLIPMEDGKLLLFLQEGLTAGDGSGSAPEVLNDAFERLDIGRWLGRSTVYLSDEEIGRRSEDGTFVVIDPSPSGTSAAAAVGAVIAFGFGPAAKSAAERKAVVDVLQSLIAPRAGAGTQDSVPAGMRQIFDLVGDPHKDRRTGTMTARC